MLDVVRDRDQRRDNGSRALIAGEEGCLKGCGSRRCTRYVANTVAGLVLVRSWSLVPCGLMIVMITADKRHFSVRVVALTTVITKRQQADA